MGLGLWPCQMLLGWVGLGSSTWERSRSALSSHFGTKTEGGPHTLPRLFSWLFPSSVRTVEEVWPHNRDASRRPVHFYYWLFHMACLCLPATYPKAHPFPACAWPRCRVTALLSCPFGFPRDQLPGGEVIWARNSTKARIVHPSTWFLWHVYIDSVLTSHGCLRMFNVLARRQILATFVNL